MPSLSASMARIKRLSTRWLAGESIAALFPDGNAQNEIQNAGARVMLAAFGEEGLLLRQCRLDVRGRYLMLTQEVRRMGAGGSNWSYFQLLIDNRNEAFTFILNSMPSNGHPPKIYKSNRLEDITTEMSRELREECILHAVGRPNPGPDDAVSIMDRSDAK